MSLISNGLQCTIVFVAALLLNITSAWSQDAPTDYVVPPSPEAVALGRYAQIPVSLYTGVPQINIPLWELKEGDITLPIALSYHAAGHKVDEIAPRTGMGWTLGSAFGVITRTIMGEADEYGLGGFLNFSKNNSPESLFSGSNEEKFDRYAGIVECADAEPDQFAFNFNGFSGKFAFNWNGEIVSGSEQKVKIEPVNMVPGSAAFIEGWRVTTADGTIYTFNATETTKLSTTFNTAYPCHYMDDNANDIAPVTSWYLSQITSPNGNKVFFEYEAYTLAYTILVSETTTHKDKWNHANTQSRKETLTINGQYLKTIMTSSGNTTIEFIPSRTARTDIPGTGITTSTLYSLGEIRIHSKEAFNIKRLKMEYDYSIGRLCLKRIHELASDGAPLKPPYVFTYTGALPAFTSGYPGAFFSQDHWGFFNGADNTQLTPPYLAINASGGTHQYSGADRGPNAAAAQAGILTQIKYPAGGTTTFEFEGHDYSFINETPLFKRDVVAAGSAFVTHSGEDSGPDYEDRRRVTSFTLNEGDTLFTYSIATDYCSGTGLGGGSLGPRVTLFDANRQPIRSWHHTPDNSHHWGTLHLPPGDYYLEAFVNNMGQCTTIDPYDPNTVILLGWDYAAANVHWYRQTEPYRHNASAGGVRIKKIIDHDGFDVSNDIIRVFEYDMDEHGCSVSSGVLPHMPRYEHDIFVYESFGITTYALRVANSLIPLSMTQGSPVGYKQVTVLYGKNGQGGKSEYYYKTFGDPGVSRNDEINPEPPFPPASSREYKRGLLSKHIDYENKDGVFLPVRQLDYRYADNDGNMNATSIFALKVGENCVNCRFGGGGRGLAMDWRFFSLAAYAVNLAISRVTGITESIFNGSEKFVTEKKFEYDEPLQFLLKESVSGNSGEERITEYIYPFHFANAPYPINLLKDRHMLSSVVEKIVKEKSANGIERVVDASLTTFAVFGNNVLPSRIFQLAPGAPILDFNTAVNNVSSPDSIFNTRFYHEIVCHSRYTSNGNVAEIITPGNVITSYIWGYNNGLPIAQMRNASADRCAFTGFETADKGNWSYTDVASNYAGDARTGRRSFRGNISITTSPGKYLVSLWAKGSGTVAVNHASKTIDAEWKRYEWIVTGPETISIMANNNLIDDVRLHPAEAQMKTFTYDLLIGVSTATDENHNTLFFEYDGLGRLKTMKDAEKNIVKNYQYHYKHD